MVDKAVPQNVAAKMKASNPGMAEDRIQAAAKKQVARKKPGDPTLASWKEEAAKGLEGTEEYDRLYQPFWGE